MRTICALLLLLALGFAGVIHPQLAEKLTTLQQGEQLEGIVHMKAQADLSTMSDATKADKTTRSILLASTFAPGKNPKTAPIINAAIK